MASEKKPFTKFDLERVIDSRYTLEYKQAPITIVGEHIECPLDLFIKRNSNSNVHTRPIVFDRCTFEEIVKVGNYDQSGRISFEQCVFNESVSVTAANVHTSTHCVFNSDLAINISSLAEVELSEYNVHGTLMLFGECNKINLQTINKSQKIEEQKIILKCRTTDLSIQFVYCQTLEFAQETNLAGEITIQDIEVLEFHIGDIQLRSTIHLNGSKVSTLKIGEVGGTYKGFLTSGSEIGEVNLKANTFNNFSIKESAIDSLQLSESNGQGSVFNIEKCTIKSIAFENLYNYGVISLRELTIPSNGLLSFRSCNLGKTDFIYCNFSDATLEFENNKITDAFFSETEFPKKVKVNNQINYGQAQLAFGQIATAFQRQGDNIRALEYLSRELEAHYHKLMWFSPDFFTKLNLWLNGMSNDFGRNWIKGITFSLGVGFLFFCFLLISTNKYNWGLPSIDFSLIPAFLKFMNPLRFFELEDLFKSTPVAGRIQLNEVSFLADFGGRIFVAYGFYQTIQAFRRFGRK